MHVVHATNEFVPIVCALVLVCSSARSLELLVAVAMDEEINRRRRAALYSRCLGRDRSALYVDGIYSMFTNYFSQYMKATPA